MHANATDAQVDRMEEEVKSQSCKLFELNHKANTLHKMLKGSHNDVKKTASLKVEIQDANNCSDEMLLYWHQINHMHQCLGNDSLSLDGQIGEILAALSTAEKERVCSQKMLAELESSHMWVSIELDETIQDTHIVDNEWTHDFAMKQQDATSTGRMGEWNKARV